MDAFGAGSNFYCTKNEDCTDGDEQFCCWGGDCCTTTEYMNEGIEAIFRSFGGYEMMHSCNLGIEVIRRLLLYFFERGAFTGMF